VDAAIRRVRQARRIRPCCSPCGAPQANRRSRLRRPTADRHDGSRRRPALRAEGSQLGAPADREAERPAARARPRHRHPLHRQRQPGLALGRMRRIAGASPARGSHASCRIGRRDRHGPRRVRAIDLSLKFGLPLAGSQGAWRRGRVDSSARRWPRGGCPSVVTVCPFSARTVAAVSEPPSRRL
jgi:hypothetical protein